MMRWLCALTNHRQFAIREVTDDGRLRTRCMNCWTVSLGIRIGQDEPEPEPPVEASSTKETT
mgnify:CR=1 FL=1